MDINLIDIDVTDHILKFKDHLDIQETIAFNVEKERIDEERENKIYALLVKYNNIVSERMSTEHLIKAAKERFNCDTPEFQEKLSRLSSLQLHLLLHFLPFANNRK
jgi:hypothetical protein